MINGKKLKELRFKHKLTRDDLAKKAGISVPEIQQIELGTRQGLRDKTLFKLADAFDLKSDELIKILEQQEEPAGEV